MLRDQTTLVLGRVSPEVAALAERTAAERGARLLRAPEDPGPELRLLAPGGFQRRNFALARTAAEAFLGELDPERGRARWRRPCRSRAASSGSPSGPPTFVDAAHNPDGAAALAEALPAVAGGRRVVACLAILADKDAAAMVASAGAGPGARRLHRAAAPTALEAHGRPGAALVGSGGGAGRRLRGGGPARPRPSRTSPPRCGAASALAAEPPEGVLLVAGSHYAIARRGRSAPRFDREPGRDCARIRRMDRGAGSQLLSMMGLVAAVVAIVILVFFGVGYLFGRLFL